MATRWTVPASGTPTYLAMKLYRNYDGKKSGFGDTSVSDVAPDPDTVSSFAAVRSSDGALTVTVINKSPSGAAPVTVSLANFTPGAAAQAWQLTSADAITRLADVAVNNGALTASLPAQSVTLFVIPTTGIPISVIPPPGGGPTPEACSEAAPEDSPEAAPETQVGSDRPAREITARAARSVRGGSQFVMPPRTS